MTEFIPRFEARQGSVQRTDKFTDKIRLKPQLSLRKSYATKDTNQGVVLNQILEKSAIRRGTASSRNAAVGMDRDSSSRISVSHARNSSLEYPQSRPHRMSPRYAMMTNRQLSFARKVYDQQVEEPRYVTPPKSTKHSKQSLSIFQQTTPPKIKIRDTSGQTNSRNQKYTPAKWFPKQTVCYSLNNKKESRRRLVIPNICPKTTADQIATQTFDNTRLDSTTTPYSYERWKSNLSQFKTFDASDGQWIPKPSNLRGNLQKERKKTSQRKRKSNNYGQWNNKRKSVDFEQGNSKRKSVDFEKGNSKRKSVDFEQGNQKRKSVDFEQENSKRQSVDFEQGNSKRKVINIEQRNYKNKSVDFEQEIDIEVFRCEIDDYLHRNIKRPYMFNG